MPGLPDDHEEIKRPSHGLALKLIATYIAVALVPLIMSGYVSVAYLQEFAAKVSEGGLAPGEVDRYVRNARGISIMVGVFAVLVGAAMSLLFTGWIVGPLRHISRFLARAAQDRDVFGRLDLRLRDEIGCLAGNVNRLLDAVTRSSTERHVLCSQCGASGDASDKFCRRCGQQVPPGQ